MCHLSIEKVLKSLYLKTLKKLPPKTHDLLFLVSKINLTIDKEKLDFLKTLNNVSIPTRYPEELSLLLKAYNKKRTLMIINKS